MSYSIRQNPIAVILLLIFGLLSTTLTAYSTPTSNFDGITYSTQQDTLPFPPDSVYNYISSTPEALIGNQPISDNLTVDEWHADLDTLAKVLKERIPYSKSAVGNIDQRLDSLKKRIPHQTRDQRFLSIFRLLNLPAKGTAHTAGWPVQRILDWDYLMFHPYKFSDGVYIMAAAQKELIGTELVSINGIPIDSVYQKLAPYASGDNRWKTERRVERFRLRYANVLKATGVIENIDQVPVTIRRSDGQTEEVMMEPAPLNSRAFVEFFTSRPKVPADHTWSPASEYQDNNEPIYDIDYRDSTDLLYLEFNNVWNASEDWTIADLADSLNHIANTQPLDKVVVDLRTNNGGDHNQLNPLVEVLTTHPKINQYGTLYTLISWRTFSAAGSFAMELERKSKTIFAGEPGSFAPNHWGSRSTFLLPYTKFTAKISPAYFPIGMPESGRTHLQPDIHVPLSSKQHFSNLDSTMIAVRNHEPEERKTRDLTEEQLAYFEGTYQISPLHIARISSDDQQLKLKVTGHALSLDMDKPGPALYLKSDLYPTNNNQLATDISGVFLKKGESDKLQLQWKGKPYALTPVPPTTQSPVEYFRDGDIQKGAEALREIKASGFKLGHNIAGEFFTLRVDELVTQDKPEQALEYAKLSVEFWPQYWLPYAELAEAYTELGQKEEALKALQKVKALAPEQYPEMLEYLEL